MQADNIIEQGQALKNEEKEIEEEANANETTEHDHPTIETSTNENPLSVRVAPQYKDKFEKLTQELGISKKMLLETLITSFIKKDQQNQREAQLGFANEVNLIAANLEEILTLFSKIAAKSQDTVGSLKSSYEQQIANLENQLKTREAKIQSLEEQNQSFKATAQAAQLSQEKLEKKQVELEEAITVKEAELKSLNYKNLELLEQLNMQRKIERENLTLRNESEKSTAELKQLKEALEAAYTEAGHLRKKLNQLEDALGEAKKNENETLIQMEKRLRHEADLDKKTALLQFQTDYNNLQGENLRNLGEINRQASEIFELKSRLAEAKNNL